MTAPVSAAPLTQPRQARSAGPSQSAAWAQRAAAVLDRPMSGLGILFVLVVIGQSLATGAALRTVLAVAGWLLWSTFAAELLLRLWVAPDRLAFLRHNWWQVALLAVPALRLVRLVAVTRTARAARVLASAVRATRSARQVVASRIGWLAVVTSIVVLAASELLFAQGVFPTYGEALHRAALATVTGEPLGRPDGLAKVLEVVLALYSVVVFAALAGALGAFFLAQHQGQRPDRTG